MFWNKSLPVFYYLIPVAVMILQTQVGPASGQGHMYMYSRFSCSDLIPKHQAEINKLRKLEDEELKKLAEKPKAASLTKAESAMLDLSVRNLLSRKADSQKRPEAGASTEQQAGEGTALDVPPKQVPVTEESVFPVEILAQRVNATNGIIPLANVTRKPRLSAQTKPESAAQKAEETTTMRPTTTTTMPPPAQKRTGASPVTILTSEDKYRRLKLITVTLQSTVYFEGFILQARQTLNQGTFKAVGRFIEPPRQAMQLTCPQGYEQDNTVVDRQRPVLLTNLTFSWVAPDTDRGAIEFVASVSTDSGRQYFTTRSQPLTLSYFPVSTKDCAQSKSCFRLCPADHIQCPGYAARYMATMSLTNANTSLTITLGGSVPTNGSYVAIGVSNDDQRLMGADLSVCYPREGGKGMALAHYLLEDVNMMPDLHQGSLDLDREDSADEQVWCSFTRPIGGDSLNSLKLDTPKYFFYFWGVKNGSDLYIPMTTNMLRSSGKIMVADGYFNEISYDCCSGYGIDRRTVAVTLAIATLYNFLW